MTAGSVFVGSVGGGRLNPAVTLAAAVAGTALVLAGLRLAFSYRVTSPPASARLLLRVVPVAAPAAMALARYTRQPAENAQAAPAVVLPAPLKAKILPNLPGLVAPKLDLSMGIPAPTVPLPKGAAAHAFNPYSDLYRSLNAARKPAKMQNGSTFQSIYGYAESRVGGVCAYSVPIEHLSLSPSVHPHVAFVAPCPGSDRPSMADELKA